MALEKGHKLLNILFPQYSGKKVNWSTVGTLIMKPDGTGSIKMIMIPVDPYWNGTFIVRDPEQFQKKPER